MADCDARGEGPKRRTRKIYLDIDGVLVVWDAEHNCVRLSNGLGQLMRFCKLRDVKPYWLTMWSRDSGTLDGINCLLWPKTCPTVAVPEICTYDRAKGKAAAIDYDSDFVWIEDGIDRRDMDILTSHGAADRYFPTSGLDPDCLLKFMDFACLKMGLEPLTDWGPAWESRWTRARPAVSD